MNTKRILPAMLGLLVATTAPVLAEGDRYRAFSTTAESITGDISMDDFSITFANGESLKFAALGAIILSSTESGSTLLSTASRPQRIPSWKMATGSAARAT